MHILVVVATDVDASDLNDFGVPESPQAATETGALCAEFNDPDKLVRRSSATSPFPSAAPPKKKRRVSASHGDSGSADAAGSVDDDSDDDVAMVTPPPVSRKARLEKRRRH